MTNKATVQIPSPRAGRVHRLCSGAGDIVAVGAVLIEIAVAATPIINYPESAILGVHAIRTLPRYGRLTSNTVN